jgi:fermentation-respiration switch protein FrsA (DUF1100 family)
MRRAVRIGLGLLTLLFLPLAAAGLWFYRLAVARADKSFLNASPDLPDYSGIDNSWVETQTFEELEMVSDDGLRLRAYYLPAPRPTSQTAILAHGYASYAKSMGVFARLYHERLGFNVLMPDARGHGASEGTYIGFGWPDRKDYLGWIRALIRRTGEETRIVLHGVSMGGATVLMTSGEDLPPQVTCAIADCAYTSARDVLAYQLKRLYHLPAFPFVPTTSLVCKLRAGYFFGEASALEQVAKTRLPILFIHGGADTFVPTEMVYRLYDRCPTTKDLFVVPGADHGLAYDHDPEGYTRRVRAFIEDRRGQGREDTLTKD